LKSILIWSLNNVGKQTFLCVMSIFLSARHVAYEARFVLQIERFNLGSKGHLWVLVRSKFRMESGENQLHKSSLESQCKSPVSTDHRNWIVVATDPTKSVTTLDWHYQFGHTMTIPSNGIQKEGDNVFDRRKAFSTTKVSCIIMNSKEFLLPSHLQQI